MSKIKSEASKEPSNHLLETNSTQFALDGDSPEYAGDILTSSLPNDPANSLHRTVNSISEATSPTSRLGLFQKAVRNSQNSNQTATRLARSYKATTARTQTKSNASASKGESGNSSSNKGSLQRSTLVASAAVAPGLHLSGLDALPAAVRAHATQILSAIEDGLAELGPALSQLATRAVNAVGGAIRVVATMAEASEVGEVLGTLSLAIEGLGAVELVISTGGLVLVVAAIGAVALSDSQGEQSGYSYEAPAPASRPQPSSSYDPYVTTPSNDVKLPDPAEYNAPITISEQPLPSTQSQPRPEAKPYTDPALAKRAWAKYKEGWDYHDKVIKDYEQDLRIEKAFLDSNTVAGRTFNLLSQKLNELEDDLRVFDRDHDGKGGLGPEISTAAYRIEHYRIPGVDDAIQDLAKVFGQVRRHVQQEDAKEKPSDSQTPAQTAPSEQAASQKAGNDIYAKFERHSNYLQQLYSGVLKLTNNGTQAVTILEKGIASYQQYSNFVRTLANKLYTNGSRTFQADMPIPQEITFLLAQVEGLAAKVSAEGQALQKEIDSEGVANVLKRLTGNVNGTNNVSQLTQAPEAQTEAGSGGRAGNNNGGTIIGGGGTNGPREPGNNNGNPDPKKPGRMVGGVVVNLPQHYDTKPGENDAPDHWESDAGRQLIDDLYRFSNDSRTKNAREAMAQINSKNPSVGDNKLVDWIIAIYNWERLVDSHRPLDVKDQYPKHFTNPPAGREKEREADTIWVFDHPMIKDVAGNLLYGYVGRVAGFNNEQLLGGAGLAQTLGNFFMHGNPEGIGPGIDDPKKHQSLESARPTAPSEPAHNPFEQGMQSINNKVQQELEALQIPQRTQILQWLATHRDTKQWDRPTDQIQVKLGLELFMQHDYLFAQPIGGQADMAGRLRILQQTLEKHLSQIPSGPTPDEVNGPHVMTNQAYKDATERQGKLLDPRNNTFDW